MAKNWDMIRLFESVNKTKINGSINEGKEVKVKYLKAGDVLSSGAKITSAPVAGLKTPAGKVEVGVEYPNGNKKTQLWGKETTVRLKD